MCRQARIPLFQWLSDVFEQDLAEWAVAQCGELFASIVAFLLEVRYCLRLRRRGVCLEVDVDFDSQAILSPLFDISVEPEDTVAGIGYAENDVTCMSE